MSLKVSIMNARRAYHCGFALRNEPWPLRYLRKYTTVTAWVSCQAEPAFQSARANQGFENYIVITSLSNMR